MDCSNQESPYQKPIRGLLGRLGNRQKVRHLLPDGELVQDG